MKHAMEGGGGGKDSQTEVLRPGLGTWRQSLPQCPGEEGILMPSRQFRGRRHAVLGVTWTPEETEVD